MILLLAFFLLFFGFLLVFFWGGGGWGVWFDVSREGQPVSLGEHGLGENRHFIRPAFMLAHFVFRFCCLDQPELDFGGVEGGEKGRRTVTNPFGLHRRLAWTGYS